MDFMTPGTLPDELMDYFDMEKAPLPETALHEIASEYPRRRVSGMPRSKSRDPRRTSEADGSCAAAGAGAIQHKARRTRQERSKGGTRVSETPDQCGQVSAGTQAWVDLSPLAGDDRVGAGRC